MHIYQTGQRHRPSRDFGKLSIMSHSSYSQQVWLFQKVFFQFNLENLLLHWKFSNIQCFIYISFSFSVQNTTFQSCLLTHFYLFYFFISFFLCFFLNYFFFWTSCYFAVLIPILGPSKWEILVGEGARRKQIVNNTQNY